ncbi:MAG TPA: hypothetical protein VHL52_08210 [Acidimicrobiia bacterium]|nr:hypothetical protein [Acidimicrobiia bacterium]
MTPPSTTISRSFTGALEVGDQTVPATVVFGESSVSLAVAGDTVGEWPTDEVEVVPAGSAYAIRAEGDTVHFMPDETTDFATFVARPEADNTGEPAPRPVSVETEPVAAETPPTPSSFDASTEERQEPFLGLADTTCEEEQIDEPALAFEDSADEFFAAGLNGPPSESGPPAFRPVVFDTPPPPAPPIEEPAEEEPETTSVDEELNGWPVVEEEAPFPPVVEPVDEQNPANPVHLADPLGEEEASPSRLGRFFRRAREVAGEEAPSATEESDDSDDTPEPITDSENLRQWGLVVAGGVVLLVIIGVVAWGLISLMGGEEEPTTETVALPSTTVAAVAPSFQATVTTLAPSTTVAAENRAAAASFVADWNGLAAEYAYHMTISAESLPISTAPTGAVHLTYGEDGILVLNMVPQGTNQDRDILVAMGMAVAWADPGLSPEGRKQLLGALGIDVDDPRLNDLGGQLDRNGVVYRVSVTDDIIRFEVAPSA